MKFLYMVVMAAMGCLLLGACNKTSQSSVPQPETLTSAVIGGGSAMIPKAVAYKMDGDYSHNVPVTVGADGQLVSFPAPSDVSASSLPVRLADGWWLDRRGIGVNSRFTRYTYEEYSALKAVPSVEELKAAIIPGARPTEVVRLPMTLGQAMNNLKAVEKWLKDNK